MNDIKIKIARLKRFEFYDTVAKNLADGISSNPKWRLVVVFLGVSDKKFKRFFDFSKYVFFRWGQDRNSTMRN